jgi:hypothetical protein
MYRVKNTVSNSSSVVAREVFGVETYLFRGRYLATGLHATIWRWRFHMEICNGESNGAEVCRLLYGIISTSGILTIC